RPAFLGTQNREYADNQGCWQQRENQERAIPSAHDVTPPFRLNLYRKPWLSPCQSLTGRPLARGVTNLLADGIQYAWFSAISPVTPPENSLRKPALTITSGAFCFFAPGGAGSLTMYTVHVHYTDALHQDRP